MQSSSNLFPENLQQSQNFVTEFFSNVLTKDRLANAYLFLGDAQANKLEIALEIAKILNCTKTTEREAACGECTNCKWIETNSHPMTPLYLEPKAESKKAIISIDLVKELQKELTKSSQYYRVVIVPEASYMTLNKHSANALLKVLEEPAANVLFLIFAKDPDMVLPTIISRSQQVKFNSNPSTLYDEEAQELLDKYYERLIVNSRLEAMDLSEDLGTNDSKVLIGFMELLQDKLAEGISSELPDQELAVLAHRVELLEEAKGQLRAFVRPKTAVEQMLNKTVGV